MFFLNQGYHVQEAVQSLDKHYREMLITGVHPNCWTEMFGNEEE